MKFRFLPLSLAALVLSACYSLAADITPPPGYVYTTPIPSAVPTGVLYFPFMPPDPQSGAAIYADRCVDCHGPAGLGDGPAAAELPNPVAALGDPALAMSRSPEDWYRAVTEGNLERYMPPFSSLSEREVWDVVAYAFTLSTNPANVAAGERLYANSCADCHGPAGAGDGPDAGGLAVPVPDFTDQAVMAERSLDDLLAGLAHPGVEGVGFFPTTLAESEQLAVVQFVRTLTFKSSGAVAGEPGYPAPGSGAGAADALEAAQDPAGGYPAPEAGEEEPLTVEDAAAGQAVAAVSGQVTNLSGGVVPEGLEVTLYGFDQFEQVFNESAEADADGRFVFDAVEMPEGRAFIVTVEHQRGSYTSELAVAGPAPAPIQFQVGIYDSTDDPSGLSIDRLHVFFEFISADTVRVAELVLITNPGDKVVLPTEDGEPSLKFSLPAGATNLQFEEGQLGEEFVALPDGGFGDLRGVAPGVTSHQVLFSFDMPFRRRFTLGQVVDLPISALVVLLPDSGVEMAGETLVSGGTREIEGRTYQLYTGGSLPAGSTLPIALSGSPDLGDAAAAGAQANLTIGVTVFGLVLISLGVWFVRRSRQWDDDEVEALEEPVPEHVHAMSEADLMDAIIALDDRFKAGDLPEGAYLKQRSLLKGQLQELLGL